MAEAKLTNGKKPHPCSYRINIQVEGINLAGQRKTSELRKNGHKPQRCCICPCHASHLMKGNEKLWREAGEELGGCAEEEAGSRVSLRGFEPRPIAEQL